MKWTYQFFATAILTVVFFVGSLCGQSGSFFEQQNEDPTSWKTFIPELTAKITVPAPPDNAMTTKELSEVKKQIMDVPDDQVYEVLYWNAGAPSYRWNQIAYKMVTFEDFARFSRTPTAWMNMAIYDAIIAAWNAKNLYDRQRPYELDPSIKPIVRLPASSSYPCEHSVTASAAAHVLAYFYPENKDSLLQLARQASASRVKAGVQYPSDVEAGWALGEKVAAYIIEEARKDGSEQKWDGQMNTDPTKWTGKYPVGITLAKYKPLFMTSCDQFRPDAPPDFSDDMEELKACRQNPRTIHLAHYWANHTGFDIWTEIANQKIFEYDLQQNVPVCAKIYALVNVAMHDAGIAIMDAKYAYWGIRPDQLDPEFKPLIYTPPFPGYPSGHATASSTAATVLAYFFPSDAAQFNTTAQECADSRFYGGIHFDTDNEVGLEMGKKIGEYAVLAWEER